MLTVETKVWERDWEAGIRHGRVERFFQLIPTPAHRRILINNVAFPHRVVEAAQDLLSRQIVHEIVVVADHLDTALEHFRLTRDMLGAGLPYSSAEARGSLHLPDGVSVPLCRRLCDGAPVRLDGRGDRAPTTPYWRRRRQPDQCYLVRAAELKSANLLRFHPASDRYPSTVVICSRSESTLGFDWNRSFAP